MIGTPNRSTAQPLNRPITCGYCGLSFLEDHGQAACQSCPLTSSCRFVRCPTCGYENPVEPAWLAALKRWRSR